jgi:hypothetical protein
MWFLTPGDTSNYFISAYGWYRHWTANIAWSPLYTSFYGSLLHLWPDARVATVGHRFVIVLIIAVLVLALMRRLLPPGLAWLVAAWWAIMPVNYAAVSEVHLFAVIPVLIAWLVLIGDPGPWRRGAALGIFAGTTLLVRNEMVVATVLFALACLVAEWRAGPGGPRRCWEMAGAYGLPLAIALLSTGLFYTVSLVRAPDL